MLVRTGSVLKEMVAAGQAEEFVGRALCVGCRNCEYGDLCEMEGRDRD
jgi:hypothetical protein